MTMIEGRHVPCWCELQPGVPAGRRDNPPRFGIARCDRASPNPPIVTAPRSTQRRLVLHGCPPGRFSAGDAAQLRALLGRWTLSPSSSGAKRPAVFGIGRSGWLDALLFGRGRWSIPDLVLEPQPPGSPEPGEVDAELQWTDASPPPSSFIAVRVEFDGLPPSRLADAVRGRIGHAGGMLPIRILARLPGGNFEPVISGTLCLDHRSPHRSVLLCASKLPQLLEVALRRAAAGQFEEPRDLLPAAHPVSSIRLMLRQLRAGLTWLRWREQWILEVRHRPEPGRAQRSAVTLRPPESAFWADPFLARVDDRIWLFFEELPFATMRGHISAVELDESGQPLSQPVTVVKEGWHLSYPFVWQEPGRTLLLPEAGSSHVLTWYESGDGGRSWQACGTMLQSHRLADATIIRWDGRLWLFATQADPGASMDDVLCIWHAHRIEGPWVPHRRNPVKIDARTSRPAGAMWIEDGLIHRVAQDCSTSYGGTTVCLRVRRLTPDDFEEEVVTGWNGRGEFSTDRWHTYNTLGSLSVTDRLVRIPRWRLLRRFQGTAR